MWILLKIFFIVCSSAMVFHLSFPFNDHFWKPKEGVFILLGLIFLAVCWLSDSKNRYIFKNKWLSYFFIYTILLFGWNFIKPSILDTRTLNYIVDNLRIISTPFYFVTSWWTVLPTLNIIIAILLIYHLVEYTDTLQRWIGVVRVICWTGFGFSIYAILQYLNCDPILKQIIVGEGSGQIYKMCTVMGNKMLSSNFIACIIPLFLIFKNKKYYIIFSISLVALCLFRSAFNISVAMVGIFTILLLQRKWKFTLISFLCFLIMLFIFNSKLGISSQIQNKFNGRINLCIIAIQDIKNHIITGKGAGSIPRDFAKTEPELGFRWHSSHNLLVDVLYEFGLIGIVLLFGYLYSLFIRIKEVFRVNGESMLLIGLCGGLASWLLVSMGSFPHRIAPLALMGILYIAGIEVHLSQRRRI